MIYQSKDVALTQLAKDRKLDFTTNKFANIKIQLSTKDQKQRIDWILNELATTPTVRDEEYLKVQLAIDEGIPASQAAGNKLREMSKNRELYEKKLGGKYSYFPGL